MVEPRRVSFRKVSLILNERYRTTAEKKMTSSIRANTMPIIAKSKDIMRSPFGFLPFHDYVDHLFC